MIGHYECSTGAQKSWNVKWRCLYGDCPGYLSGNCQSFFNVVQQPINLEMLSEGA
jgi:hypothetical protein